MNATHIDVMMELDSGDAEQLESVQRLLRRCRGVRDVRPSERLERLMLVEYDARSVSSRSLLEQVRASGVGARLVGM